MFKYAFIVNSEKMSPETYSWEYENEEMRFEFLATSGMEMTCEYGKKLADEGIECIDLCGDFDEAQAKEVSNAANGKVEVCYAKYFDEELAKLDALEQMSEYGIIIMADGLPQGSIKTKKITSDEFNTTLALVDSDETAKSAANNMVAEGINFVELCSYFDADKTRDIIEAIDGKVPIGYCG